jgi:hypothetical protein
MDPCTVELFYAAIAAGELDKVKDLFDENREIQEQIFIPPAHRSPLFVAAQHGHLPVVEYLHSEGFSSIDSLTDGKFKGSTPLEIAKKKKYEDVTQYLLKVGPHQAIQFGKLSKLKDLVSQGASVLDPIEDWVSQGVTPIFLAAQYGQLDTIKYLVSHGANISSPISVGIYKGKTPLYIALKSVEAHPNEHKYQSVVDYLRANGETLSPALQVSLDGQLTPMPSYSPTCQTYLTSDQDALVEVKSSLFVSHRATSQKTDFWSFFTCFRDDAANQDSSKLHVGDGSSMIESKIFACING